VRAPGEDGLVLRVVVREVVLRKVDGQAGVHVTPELVRQGVSAVLKVTGHVDLVEVARGNERRAAGEALRKNVQLRVVGQLAHLNGGVARVRHVVHLVKAVGEEVVLVAQALREHAEELLPQRLLGNLVQVPQASERAPAQEHGREHVRLRPINNFAELVPIIHGIELQVLHGRAGDDHAVVELVLELVERLVELDQVVLRDVRGGVAAHAHEVAGHLQGRLGDETQNLRLRLDLLRHEVENHHVQGADLLARCRLFLQREDALSVQYCLRGKPVGNVDWHEACSYRHLGRNCLAPAGR